MGLSPLTVLHQEGIVSQPIDTLQGSGNSLKTFLNCKRRQLLQRKIFICRFDYKKSSPVFLVVHKHFTIRVRITFHYQGQYSFMDLCFDAILHLLMIHYVLSSPTTESSKGMHTSGTPASAHQGSKCNILR